MRSLPGGITYTWFASTAVAFATSDTGILLTRDSRDTSELSCFAARCCTSTIAIPLFAGMLERSWVTASRPPAEAPTATTGNTAPPVRAAFFFCFLGWVRRALRLGFILAPTGETRSCLGEKPRSAYGASLPPGNDGPLAGDWNQVLSLSSRRNIYHRETVVAKQMSSGSERAPARPSYSRVCSSLRGNPMLLFRGSRAGDLEIEKHRAGRVKRIAELGALRVAGIEAQRRNRSGVVRQHRAVPPDVGRLVLDVAVGIRLRKIAQLDGPRGGGAGVVLVHLLADHAQVLHRIGV